MKRQLYLKLTIIAVYVISITFLTSCQDDNEPPSSDEVIIAEGVQVINNQTWNDNLLAIDTTNYTIRFSEDISAAQSFKAGDYIISSSGEGLLRKIKSISSDNNEIVVQTEFASLTDVIEQG